MGEETQARNEAAAWVGRSVGAHSGMESTGSGVCAGDGDPGRLQLMCAGARCAPGM